MVRGDAVIQANHPALDVADAFLDTAHAILDKQLAADDPAVRRIVLVDAPSVVGWEARREIDGRYALGLLKSALAAASASGRLAAASVELSAHLLLAVLIEAALIVARAADRTQAIEAARNAIDRVLDAFIE